MLTVLATILPLVSRCATTSVKLYKLAAESQGRSGDLLQVASDINSYGSILKQTGTIIKEDDRLPSNEAIDTLEDVIAQSLIILADIESVSFIRNDERFGWASARDTGEGTCLKKLDYRAAHLEALRATLSVLLQTLFTAQSIMWSKLRPSISPQQTTAAVTNERNQLQALVIEQQLSILRCSTIFETATQQHTHLLTGEDNSLSLTFTNRGDSLKPADLYRYLNKHIAGLDVSAFTDSKKAMEVCNIAPCQSERLVERWTNLLDFDKRLRDAEREAQKQKQETQQPTVESDSEDDASHRRRRPGSGARMASQQNGTLQPLIIERASLPIPVPENKFGPAAPLSPAASPRNSRTSFSTPAQEYSSPHSSIATLPVEAAAAIEAKEEDNGLDLEIPWTLCTRRHYWKYIDNRIIDTNTDHNPSMASSERNTWTEITASWVCKEAIKEAGYRYTQVQKDREDGRRTRFETCFFIESALQFNQVKRLVERTVELYRKTVPPTPPPQARSFQPPPPPVTKSSKAHGPDRDRTPVPRNTHPPFERSTSSLPFSASYPPLLDRSFSMPGTGLTPPAQQQYQARPAPYNTNLQPQIPWQGYMPHPPKPATYPPQPFTYTHMNSATNKQQQQQQQQQPAPARNSYLDPRSAGKYNDTMTSDSESGEKERWRRQRSKSRSSKHSSDKKKMATTAMGALMGVGGLTALLDGLSGL